LTKFPGKRMLAPATTNEKNFHDPSKQG
jgi:hypothetical protein